MQRRPAVQHEGLPVGVARGGGSEEEDGVGDLVGGDEAAEGVRVCDLGLQAGHLGEVGVEHGAVDVGGRDGVDADAFAGGFEGCVLWGELLGSEKGVFFFGGGVQ